MTILRQETYLLFLTFEFFAMQTGFSQEITGKSDFSVTPIIQRRFTNQLTLLCNTNVALHTGVLEIEKFRLISSFFRY